MPTTDHAAAKLVAECGNRLDRMLTCLDKAGERGGIAAQRDLQKRLLRSGSARIAAMARSVKRNGLHWTASEIVKEGLSLDLWNYSGEQVRLMWRPRSDGRFRPVFSYGPKEYAKAWLAMRSCRILCRLSGHQFLHRGGVPAIAGWLVEQTTNTTIVTTTDVPNCFGVLSRQHVEADRLLPKPVIKALLYDTMKMAKQKKDPALLHVGGPLGLFMVSSVNGSGFHPMPGNFPAGSALTSLLADQRIRSLLDAVEKAVEGVTMGSFADNLIILAPSTKKAVAAKSALRQAVLDEYGKDVADEIWDRMRTSSASQGFYFLNDHYEHDGERLVRRMSDSVLEGYPARLTADVFEKKLSPTQIHLRIAGWERYRSYDPRAAIAANEFRAMFELSDGDAEDASETEEDGFDDMVWLSSVPEDCPWDA